MANLKQIRKHIASVQNTGKITKAMKMVAVSKLRKSQAAVVATRPYVNELINVIEHLVAKSEGATHPLLRNPDVKKRAVLIVVSGDKGLCGAYNHNIVKSAKKFVAERGSKHDLIRLIFVGRKAYEAMRHVEGENVEKILVEGGWDRSASEVALEISKSLCEEFSEEKIDEVYILYTVFKSAIAQSVVLDGVLPLQSIITNCDADGKALFSAEEQAMLDDTSYIYEPSNHEILDILLPRAVAIHVQRSLLEGLASENGARMTAMDNAARNATEMIGRLTLQFNRARQAAITTELNEVVSGAEAL
ncbi:MAG: ATP synthase F1 subunit gamma [Proteobacteria bacterium]|nr:ATP synthase F1 subunit gamma [Pseudomonadota bacterium]